MDSWLASVWQALASTTRHCPATPANSWPKSYTYRAPDPEEDDEAEAAYAELVEYLRVGVLLLREEIGSLAARNTAIGRLH